MFLLLYTYFTTSSSGFLAYFVTKKPLRSLHVFYLDQLFFFRYSAQRLFKLQTNILMEVNLLKHVLTHEESKSIFQNRARKIKGSPLHTNSNLTLSKYNLRRMKIRSLIYKNIKKSNIYNRMVSPSFPTCIYPKLNCENAISLWVGQEVCITVCTCITSKLVRVVLEGCGLISEFNYNETKKV